MFRGALTQATGLLCSTPTQSSFHLLVCLLSPQFTNDSSLVKDMLPLLVKEYSFWMTNRSVNVSGGWMKCSFAGEQVSLHSFFPGSHLNMFSYTQLETTSTPSTSTTWTLRHRGPSLSRRLVYARKSKSVSGVYVQCGVLVTYFLSYLLFNNRTLLQRKG